MKRILLIIVLFFAFFIWLASAQNRVVAFTVVVKDRDAKELAQIKAEFEKVALKYNLELREIPLGSLIENKMKSLK